MRSLKAALLVLACFLLSPLRGSAQELDLSLKLRGTDFIGKFGNTYSALGVEPSLTLKLSEKPWAGGFSFSGNVLGYDANSDLDADLSLITFHMGGKGSVGKYFHPFAYGLLGLRLMDYKSSATSSDEDPLFTSFSVGYGVRTGLQIGSGKWRFEGSIEYLAGTRSRYLTPEAFDEATNNGEDFRDYVQHSTINGLTIGAGVTYVISWKNITID